MTSSEFREMILIKEPKYSVTMSNLFEKLANKGKQQGEFSQFGPYYELYVYAFYIGIKIGSRIQLAQGSNAKTFVNIKGWKAASPLIDFLLLTIFSRSDEIGFDWNQLEDMDEKELAEVVRKIITYIEEYAYGGLDYLKNKFDNGELDNSQYLFVDLMNE